MLFLKLLILFLSVMVIMPVVFFLLLGSVAHWFTISIEPDSLVSRLQSKVSKLQPKYAWIGRISPKI